MRDHENLMNMKKQATDLFNTSNKKGKFLVQRLEVFVFLDETHLTFLFCSVNLTFMVCVCVCA